ncbi:sce7726 family protein [Qipengyuania sp. CAU 1752]
MKRKEDIQATALARFFSAGVLKELAKLGRSPLFVRLLHESRIPHDPDSAVPVSQLFEQAFDLLKERGNRHEYIYKAALTEKVLLGIHSLQTASMLNEFRIGPCKADLVILNGTGTVYEIKSERDSLCRLNDQIHAYSRVFAKVNVIVGKNHLKAVEKCVPKHVGIQVLSDRYQISSMREAEENASRTEAAAIFDAITLQEAKVILGRAGVSMADVPNTQRYSAWRKQFAQLDPEFAHRMMVKVLKGTRNLQSLESLLEEIPQSLYCASLSARLRAKERGRLVIALQTPLREAIAWS